MPLNIQTLNSTVNVTDGNSPISDEVMEHIIKQVLMRLQAEQVAVGQTQTNRDIQPRMTDG